MPILVDYMCGSCGTRREIWAPSPPSATATCVDCGAESRRAWAPVGLSGSPAPATGPAPSPVRRSLCSSFPQVPGLCHMSESAGRMAVAKYLGDGRRIDREQERQEKAAAVKAPVLADAISHHHA
ncbi:hypothetical protein [Nocardioides sp. URHA0032]|uniref:hypothetical protein n=1 Tax=Nocardioides sp. URHA0032 TaxID=1380388 RepID=UPI000B053BB5|nr:hypothetical protein [Nocardioides sp. URHA0032]